MPTRRFILRNSAIALAGAGAAPFWLERALYAADAPVARQKDLVAIFQRGAADGLNVVVPHGEKAYYTLRPSIAIPRPTSDPRKRDDAAVDLDGFFGLHPSLAPLKPLFDRRHLAIIEAVGSPHPTRSHFDAQDYMESGMPGRKASEGGKANDAGWMGRALYRAAGAAPPVRVMSRAVGFLRGTRGGTRGSAADTRRAIERQTYAPSTGAEYPRGRFGRRLQEIAQSIKSGAGTGIACADMDGWDHHVNQAGPRPSEGALADTLREFGQALSAFWKDMGDRMDDVVVVTMSEFGRTARENGKRGTDHGRANCMFVMGGAIKGGKVYGKWPGLEKEQLCEGRDLALTTDFRDVLGELVSRHLGNPSLENVFPGHDPKMLGLV